MIYFLSKVIGAVTNPVVLTFILLCIATMSFCLKRRRTAFFFLSSTVVWLGLVLFTPLSNNVILPLEGRFAKPDPIPDHIDGIITLGGGLEFIIAHERNIVEQANAADRLYETAILANKFPEAKIVYTGATKIVGERSYSSGEVAKKYLVDLGINPQRIILEERAKNTFENALLSKKLVNPSKEQKWVLITSAYHMPRAVGVFRAQKWDVIPWPSDYQTHGPSAASDFSYSSLSNLETLNLALHEWVGLVTYRVLGRTEETFPNPEKPAKN